MQQNAPKPANNLDSSRIDTWIFDLDNTLYRTSPEMLAQIDHLMGSFISDFLNVDRTEARRIQKGYFHTHGLTLRGLMLEHGLDPQDYIDHLSQLDLSDVSPNPVDIQDGELVGEVGHLARHMNRRDHRSIGMREQLRLE